MISICWYISYWGLNWYIVYYVYWRLCFSSLSLNNLYKQYFELGETIVASFNINLYPLFNIVYQNVLMKLYLLVASHIHLEKLPLTPFETSNLFEISLLHHCTIKSLPLWNLFSWRWQKERLGDLQGKWMERSYQVLKYYFFSTIVIILFSSACFYLKYKQQFLYRIKNARFLWQQDISWY